MIVYINKINLLLNSLLRKFYFKQSIKVHMLMKVYIVIEWIHEVLKILLVWDYEIQKFRRILIIRI